MWRLNELKTIEYRGGYVFRVTFDDGTTADVDFTDYLERGPVFAPLRDLSFFRRARIEGGTIAWPNGADIAPKVLYDKAQSAGERIARSETPVARDRKPGD